VNLWGALVYIVASILSDRYRSHFVPLVLAAPFGMAGYAILLTKASPAAQYAATYLIATCCYVCIGIGLTWGTVNCATDGKRAAAYEII
jgi:hypothetical protein